MPKVVPDYKKQAKNIFMDSASQLFFDLGYHETSMEDIAKMVGVTKGTLYLYFKSKEDLLNETCKRNMTLLEQSLENAISGDFVQNVCGFFEAELKMPDYLRFHWIFALGEINSNKYVRQVLMDSYEKYVSILDRTIEELKNKGSILKETDSRSLSKMLIAFHNGLLTSMMQGLNEAEAASVFRDGVLAILSSAGYH